MGRKNFNNELANILRSAAGYMTYNAYEFEKKGRLSFSQEIRLRQLLGRQFMAVAFVDRQQAIGLSRKIMDTLAELGDERAGLLMGVLNLVEPRSARHKHIPAFWYTFDEAQEGQPFIRLETYAEVADRLANEVAKASEDNAMLQELIPTIIGKLEEAYLDREIGWVERNEDDEDEETVVHSEELENNALAEQLQEAEAKRLEKVQEELDELEAQLEDE